jgi:outer membrane protein TolC
MNYEEARNQAEFKRRQLFSAMGIPPQDVAIEDPDLEKLPEVRYNEDELFRFAEVFSPALQVFDVKRKIQKKRVDIERAGRYPSVALHFALGVENSKLYGFEDILENFYPSNWSPIFTWTFEARVPIYHGGSIGARIDSEKAKYNKMVYEEKDVRLNLKNMIANNLQSLNNLKNRITLSEKMIADTEKHLLLATRSYESGASSQFELQDAERSVLTSKMANVRARYTYMMTLATMANIIGVDEERICQR